MDVKTATEDQMVNEIMNRLMAEATELRNNQMAVDIVQKWLTGLITYHPEQTDKIKRAADRAGEIFLKVIRTTTKPGSSSVPPGEKLGQPTIKRGEPK